MITASQARKMAEESDASVQRILSDKFELVIKKAAETGARTCSIVTGHTTSFTGTAESTSVDQRVLTELRKLGYNASFGSIGFPYKARGSGETITNTGIILSW